MYFRQFSRIEKKYFKKRENKPITADILKKKDKKYFWLQLLLPLGLYLLMSRQQELHVETEEQHPSFPDYIHVFFSPYSIQ